MKKSKKITPLQLVLVLIILVAAALYKGLDLQEVIESEETPAQSATTQVDKATSPAGDTGKNAPTEIPRVNTREAVSIQPSASADFDYFLLVLSWSPDYCSSSDNSKEDQCLIGKKLGFVLHGLWPEYERGYPSECSSQKLPDAVKNEFTGLYPSDYLFTHEWEKHGTCSGLEPEQYLTVTQSLKQSLRIPDAYLSPASPFRTTSSRLKGDFTAINTGISADGLAVFCSSSGKYLKELYVCYTREGSPRACSTEVQKNASKSCQKSDFLVRNTR